MNILLDLFLTFAKIGLFTFGGGYAMISMIEDQCVERKQWITHDELMNMTIVAESTPGPIAINCATYVGFKQGGALGSAAATLGVVMPSFIIIYVISLFLDAFLTLELVSYAFRGIQAGVVYLILSAGVKMLRSMKKDAMSVSICVGVLLLMLVLSALAVDFSAILFILISGAVGLSVWAARRIMNKRGEGEK